MILSDKSIINPKQANMAENPKCALASIARAALAPNTELAAAALIHDGEVRIENGAGWAFYEGG